VYSVMEALRQHIKPGKVYRRSDLEYYSSAIDRHLGMLTKDGSLIKLSHGVYYAPRSSKFGMVPPDDAVWVEGFLKDSNFLLVKPNLYNALGLGLTQLYNTTWVYNHKRKGGFRFNGKTFEFKIKTSFPRQLTREFLLVDLLNHLDELSEDRNGIIERLPDVLNRFDENELRRLAQQYGSGSTRRLIKSICRIRLQHA